MANKQVTATVFELNPGAYVCQFEFEGKSYQYDIENPNCYQWAIEEFSQSFDVELAQIEVSVAE